MVIDDPSGKSSLGIEAAVLAEVLVRPLALGEPSKN